MTPKGVHNAPLKSSLYASGLINDNSLQPVANNQLVLQESVEPYLVLLHGVCPNWAVAKKWQKKDSAIGVVDFTTKDSKVLESDIRMLRARLQNSIARFLRMCTSRRMEVFSAFGLRLASLSLASTHLTASMGRNIGSNLPRIESDPLLRAVITSKVH